MPAASTRCYKVATNVFPTAERRTQKLGLHWWLGHCAEHWPPVSIKQHYPLVYLAGIVVGRPTLSHAPSGQLRHFVQRSRFFHRSISRDLPCGISSPQQ